MKKIRRKGDKRINIDLAITLQNKLRKLARIENTPLKPYIENTLAEHVFEKEENGII